MSDPAILPRVVSRFNPANAVTASRFLMLPPFVWAVDRGYPQWATLFMFVCGILDKLDGAVAKIFDCRSVFGEVFDAVTDGICYGFAIVIVVAYGWAPVVPALVVVGLGTANTALRFVYGQRLDVHAASLTADLGELGGVLDRLRPGIHVALTARCKRDSRLLSGLKHAQRAGPERQERRQAPQAMYVDRDQQHGDANAGGDQDHAEPRAFSTLPKPDVRDASRRGVSSFAHDVLPYLGVDGRSDSTAPGARDGKRIASYIYRYISIGHEDQGSEPRRRTPAPDRRTAGSSNPIRVPPDLQTAEPRPTVAWILGEGRTLAFTRGSSVSDRAIAVDFWRRPGGLDPVAAARLNGLDDDPPHRVG